MLRFFQNLEIWIFDKLLEFFGLDLVKISTVLDGFFPYLAQIITSMREYVAYYDLWPWPISSRSFDLDLENRVRSVASTVLDGFFQYLYKWSLAWEGVSHVMTFDLDLYLQGHSTLFWLGIQHDSIVWVIMRRRGVSSERSSCSSFLWVQVTIFQYLFRYRFCFLYTISNNVISNHYHLMQSYSLKNVCHVIVGQIRFWQCLCNKTLYSNNITYAGTSPRL